MLESTLWALAGRKVYMYGRWVVVSLVGCQTTDDGPNYVPGWRWNNLEPGDVHPLRTGVYQSGAHMQINQ